MGLKWAKALSLNQIDLAYMKLCNLRSLITSKIESYICLLSELFRMHGFIIFFLFFIFKIIIIIIIKIHEKKGNKEIIIWQIILCRISSFILGQNLVVNYAFAVVFRMQLYWACIEEWRYRCYLLVNWLWRSAWDTLSNIFDAHLC